ncbi:hypothetical protein AB3S75_026743 [Citrus x aurantiifolia]
MPLLHNRVTKATYQEIVDTVDKKLSGWNAMLLSLAGRITLAQSVIQAIPILPCKQQGSLMEFWIKLIGFLEDLFGGARMEAVNSV